jgi:Cu(I)/Ag(I) efflux system membrane fusion protein
MSKIDRKSLYVGLGFLVAGLLLGWLFFGGSSEREAITEEQVEEHIHEEGEAEIWTCSMHPQIRQEEPGNCPICGMELIQVQASAAVDDSEIQMSEAAARIADIQTVIVQSGSPTKEIYLPGRVTADERNVSAVTARFPGRIEKLYVNFTGQEVRRGERLASIYSPELVQAQKELLEAVRFKETNPSFYEAAVRKLKQWDLTGDQIENIQENGQVQYNFDVYSTQSGTVTSRKISEGDYVGEGQPLFDIANLNKVWVLYDAYESDLAWIKEGDKVTFSVPSMPGQTFSSTVTFIDPVINPQTRVALVRTEVDNPKGQLKPDMFAQGVINSKLENMENALVIPKSSVLWTGKRAVVYVKSPEFEEPTFGFREIILGPEAGDFYVVTEGLEAGDEVVANGVFKVDAAAQLQGKRSMMNPGGGPAMTGHNHGGMEMEKENDMPEQTKTSKFVQEDVMDMSKDVPKVFKNQLNEVIEAYLELKEGLVRANIDETQESSTELLTALDKLDGNSLSGHAKDFWEEKETFLFKHTKLCKEANTIEGKRENFIFLSQPLIKIVEAFGANQKLYVNFCPMANNNKGAYWLSNSEEIRNPFFGEAMLTCGEVKSVIN